MYYLAVKNLHMVLALLSISGFMLRAALKMYHPLALNRRWLKVAPHTVDTLLLGCAVYLCITSGQYPFSTNWLSAKLVSLLFYIGFGVLLMRFAQSKRQQLLALLGAMLSFSYIVAVAFTKSPYPWHSISL